MRDGVWLVFAWMHPVLMLRRSCTATRQRCRPSRLQTACCSHAVAYALGEECITCCPGPGSSLWSSDHRPHPLLGLTCS